MDYGCAGARGSLFEAAACQMKRPGHLPPARNSAPSRDASHVRKAPLINHGGSGIAFPSFPSLPPPLPPLPQVMYYECCLITEPRILHTGWHIYLFVLYLFASHLYAKSFCDRLVYSLALPRRDQTNEQIEEGRRAIDGQSSGRCAAG